NEAKGRAVLAESLAAQRKTADAKKAISEADLALSKCHSRDAHLSIETVLARAQALVGEGAAAQKRLAPVLEEAQKRGLVRFELEARLALGEAQAGAAGKATLLALAKDAGARGFKGLAERAQKR